MKTRLQVTKEYLQGLAGLSKCSERSVAAIITDSSFSQIHSVGINGGPKGLADCLCVVDGKYGCVHAEQNCLNKNVCVDEDKVMMVTLAPCKQCAASIINTPGGFSTVYYIEDWKEDTGLRLLKAAGIRVVQI